MLHLYNDSGAVGRERMGTAFPHKKLSGNGVPIRDFLRDILYIVLLFLLIWLFSTVAMLQQFVHLKPCQN